MNHIQSVPTNVKPAGRPAATSASQTLASETLEFVGFTPSKRIREDIWMEIYRVLRATCPRASLSGSVVAVRGGFEVNLKFVADPWEFSARSMGFNCVDCFKRSTAQIREHWLFVSGADTFLGTTNNIRKELG